MAEGLSTRAITFRVIATTRGSGASGASGEALGAGSSASDEWPSRHERPWPLTRRPQAGKYLGQHAS